MEICEFVQSSNLDLPVQNFLSKLNKAFKRNKEFNIIRPQTKPELLQDFRREFQLETNSNFVCSNVGVIFYHRFWAKETYKRCNNIVFLRDDTLGKIVQFIGTKCTCRVNCLCEPPLLILSTFKVKKLKQMPYIYYCANGVSLTRELISSKLLLPLKKFFVYRNDIKTYYIDVVNLFETD